MTVSYAVSIYCFVAAFVLIGYVGGQERMYCSHKTLHLSFLEPSVYARILGKCYIAEIFKCKIILQYIQLIGTMGHCI